ncbi:MAG: GNAT family N-acetyltransferase [Thermoplasmata archaeon]|nr:GNAT family N-acetyltransferase [Thermoplasmata archaeon]
MEIRPLEWKDFAGLTEVYLDLYQEVETNPSLGISLMPSPPSLADEAVWFARLYAAVLERNAVVSVAVEDGRVVGSCTVERRDRHAETHDIGTLGLLVARGRRGAGVGSKLLVDALARCRGLFEVVVLTVRADNLPARRIYERVGFQSFGALPHGFRRGGVWSEMVWMWADLTQPGGHAAERKTA